jgi:tetratricopeptide (TPR) repeat protein
VTVKLDDLISRIKQDQKSRIKAEEPLSFNIYAVHENVDQTTTGLNGHFVHSLLLIDVLLRMKTINTDKEQLISLCNNEYKGNATQLAIVREFENDYSSDKALWWYSRESFLYKILNKALRTQNIDVLFLFRFVIGDVYRQLKQNQCKSIVRVYRGQVMSNDEINSLRHSRDNFISINSFLSTSLDRQKALGFLYQMEISDNLHRVLFEIDADPDLMISKPFANISKLSDYGDEQEVLFMIGCVFRLMDIRQSDDDEMWIIRMKLCGDNEHDMKKLFEHMKKYYAGGDVLSFGRVLREMGKFDSAEKFYRRLLDELLPNDSSLSLLYFSLGLVTMDKGDYDSSLQWFHKSLEIYIRTDPSDYVAISDVYIWIGVLHCNKGNNNEGLEWYNKGVALFKQAHDENHLYNNIAIIYENQKKYSEALDNYNKGLAIDEKHLPYDHPNFGKTHHNIGNVYKSLGHYDPAMKHYNQSLQIKLKSLPASHASIAATYECIGSVHENKGELKQALVYYEKASTIYHQSLPPQHPNIMRITKSIQRVSSKLK